MKLYATTTSERASKGQGGNKKLETEFYIGDKLQPFLAVLVQLQALENDLYKIKIGYGDLDNEIEYIINAHGFIQKGKHKAELCYCQESGLSVPHYKDDHGTSKGKQKKDEQSQIYDKGQYTDIQ